MQDDKTANTAALADISNVPASGRLLAVDPGTKRFGLAVSDPQRVVVTRLPILKRTSWKKTLSDIRRTVGEYDAVAVIVGLPLSFEADEPAMAAEARKIAEKLALSLPMPVLLQDERATTYEARGRLWAIGVPDEEFRDLLDSEAAAVILGDFIDRLGRAIR